MAYEIRRGSMGWRERYGDVLDYAAEHIPGLWHMTVSQTREPMNNLFGTAFGCGEPVEKALHYWQRMLINRRGDGSCGV